ncbi:hypothetical protein EUX98_g5192 [Antrodiella citrinella]|uniref:Uncharacterized protein n=1 Tax=Antrodiella citrinella TaxID=2447956 RepID=A0A4S4MS60_9APHY|nr:hypothetical protein EUX98_g5192 [Antrodiella citrinella]
MEPVRIMTSPLSSAATADLTPASTPATKSAAHVSVEAASGVATVPATSYSTVPAKISLLIHECTDAHIPERIDTKSRTGRNRRPDVVRAKAVEKGHSIPAMAGAFAYAIDAEKLVLNHIGSRFPAPPPPNHSYSEWHKFQQACIDEIERQALETFQPSFASSRSFQNKSVIAAWDFLTIEVFAYEPDEDRYDRGKVQEAIEMFREGSSHDSKRTSYHNRGDSSQPRRGREQSGGGSSYGGSKKPRK